MASSASISNICIQLKTVRYDWKEAIMIPWSKEGESDLPVSDGLLG